MTIDELISVLKHIKRNRERSGGDEVVIQHCPSGAGFPEMDGEVFAVSEPLVIGFARGGRPALVLLADLECDVRGLRRDPNEVVVIRQERAGKGR